MPLVEIHLRTGRTPEQKRDLLDRVTQAVHESLGTPLERIRVWLQEFEPDAYMAGGVLMSDRDRPSRE